MWDITKHALLIDTPGGAKAGSKAINEQPIYSFSGHQVSEGVCVGVGVWVCRCVCRCLCMCVHVCVGASALPSVLALIVQHMLAT